MIHILNVSNCNKKTVFRILSKEIIKYKVNRFISYSIITYSFFLLIFFILIKNINSLEYNWGVLFLVIIFLKIIIDNLWLTFGIIVLNIETKEIVINKKIFNITLYRKKIIKPFNVELVQDLKSSYYVGRPRNWSSYYHKNGLRFTDNNDKLIYEIGLNDNTNPQIIFDKIN